MAELAEIVFDSLHPARLAGFWAAVLDGFEVRACDAAEIERLTTLGHTPETDPAVAVDGPALTKVDRNRLHLDVVTADRSGHYRVVRGPRDIAALHRELMSMEEGEPA